MAGVPGRSGGKRDGAGRKAKAEKYKAPIDRMERGLAKALPANIANIQELADGGYERVTITAEPAALVLVEQYEDILDADGKQTGKVTKRKVSAFPALPPDQLVVVKRVVSLAEKNFAANAYLVDRIAGRPGAQEEPDETEETGPPPLDLSKLTSEEMDVWERLAKKCRPDGADPGGEGAA